MAKSETKAELLARIETLELAAKAREEVDRLAASQKKQGWTAQQRLGLAVGSVGVAVLALSVVHCTVAIAALTGSGIFLAALLAIGIDCGLVVCELSSIASPAVQVRRWAMCYIALAVLLSCGLNGWASAHHAEQGLRVAAWLVGGLIPILVFVLGKVAGLLWEAPSHA